MNKKAFGVFASLLAVAMFALPMSVVFAAKPEPYTATLTGTYYVNPTQYEIFRVFPAGESGSMIFKYKGLVQTWTGDIAGEGTYDGNWVFKNAGTPDLEMHTVGIQLIEDAVVSGIGTGDLKIKATDFAMEIISGTGDLEGIKGTGIIVAPNPITFHYTLDVEIVL